LIGMLEERFGVSVDDDEIDGQTFASVGSLTAFVVSKLSG
jgi:acyl carrier protein